MSVNPKYPIGFFITPKEFGVISEWINKIAHFPEQLSKLVAPLTDEQKHWQYRPQGWTIAQVIHHCADSHINSYIRFKWALTEDKCTIKAYDETTWAQLIDARDTDVSASLLLLKGLHQRWTYLLSSLTKNELERSYFHPESKKEITIQTAIAMYAWHCEHHLAHIKLAIDNKGNL